MAQVNWTDQAINDLINIADFIAKDSVKYAKITIDRIRTSAKQLKTLPYSGRKIPEVNIDSVRELIFGNYRIIYFVASSNKVDILTVHHSAKRLDVELLKI